MHLTERLLHNAENNPQGEALIELDGDGGTKQTLTHRMLAGQVEAMTAHLRPYTGTTALLVLDHGNEFAVFFWSCLAAGVTAVPLPPPDFTKIPQRQLFRQIIVETRAGMILTEERLGQAFDSFLAEEELTGIAVITDPTRLPMQAEPSVISREDPPAVLLYTSGSTSAPKGVIIRASNLVYNARTCCEAWHIQANSTLVSWMPHHHSFGLIFNLLLPLYSGCSVVTMAPRTFAAKPDLWLRSISRFRATHSAAAAFGYAYCAERVDPDDLAGVDLSSWQVGLASAEPVRHGIYQQFMQRFTGLGLDPSFFCVLYGLSETGPVTTMPAAEMPVFENPREVPAELGLACVGSAFPGTVVRCVSPKSQQPLGEDEVGELWVSGPSVTEAYLHGANAEAFSTALGDGRRYFRTGDLGHLKEGRLTITGRLKELIIRSGKNYYPQDMELLAPKAHQDLSGSSAAMFSVAEQGREHIVLLMEKPVTGEAAPYAHWCHAVAHFLTAHLGLAPDRLIVVTEGGIAKTASGKVRRGACREAYLNQELEILYTHAAEAPAVTEDTSKRERQFDQLRRAVAEHLEIPAEDLNLNQSFSELGLDSLKILAIAQALEEHLGCAVHPNLFFKYPSLHDLIQGVMEAQKLREQS